MTYTAQVKEKLNGILEKTYDAEKGFKKAADNIDNKALKNYFSAKSFEKNTFGKELETEITAGNKEVKKEGSLTGSAKSTWMDTKALFSLDNEEFILEVAIKGEKTTVKEYEAIIKEPSLPTSTKSLLEAQKSKIENGLYNSKSLEPIC
ncbi:ferritin-like domain-containing protein [Polaribacter glomeratus]|uniref:DUF2383 domain-containing protein n=1 Tax=Polaribacter glomeratus TaxID=102 RepID=A0A2S7WJI0_9FLAO|nr:PA2169 family four-helix-bundle protein [Polaribacter glomeratus]PQJ77452.1 hypothetical protein BTO16_16645 [Polaribacter glomeratus]